VFCTGLWRGRAGTFRLRPSRWELAGRRCIGRCGSWGFKEQRKEAVLFCKKEPKNFCKFACVAQSPPIGIGPRKPTDKSLFASISSEKEESFPYAF
jgi:hypothetical protein